MAWFILLAVAIVVVVTAGMIIRGLLLARKGIDDSLWLYAGLLALVFGLPVISVLGAIGAIILWHAGLTSLISMVITSGILLIVAIAGAVVLWIFNKM